MAALPYTVSPNVPLDWPPWCWVSYSSSNAIGSYPGAITCSGADAANYTINYVPGTLNIALPLSPVFSNLSFSQVIPYGTPSITLSGTIAAGAATPPAGENVSITIQGVSVSAAINNGNFSTTFDTHALPALPVPYTITYTYAGDGLFNSAADSSTGLTVQSANTTGFGLVNLGVTSNTMTFTLTLPNGGTVAAVNMLTQGTPSLDFQTPADTCWGNSYNPGGQCTVDVTFTPQYPGLRMGAVVLQDNSTPPNVLATAFISGTGSGPLLLFDNRSWTPQMGAGLSNPQGVAVDGAGNVYITDTGNNRVVDVSAGSGTQTTIGTGFNAPQGVAVDGAGNVYIADTGNNQVVEVRAGGGTQTTIGTGFNGPRGVAVDGAGNIYVADTGNNQIVIIPAGGGSQTTFCGGPNSSSACQALNGPAGVAVDGAGNVYIADTGNSQVLLMAAAGGNPVLICSGWSSPTQSATCSMLGVPVGLAVDAANNVYIADTGAQNVMKVTAGGRSATYVDWGGYIPTAVTLDGMGNLYVADVRVQLHRQSGHGDRSRLGASVYGGGWDELCESAH
jgi:sugar lactone lactonase YvrE